MTSNDLERTLNSLPVCSATFREPMECRGLDTPVWPNVAVRGFINLVKGDACPRHNHRLVIFVSATRTPSCKDSRRNAMLRHDQALKEGLDEVAKAGFRAVT